MLFCCKLIFLQVIFDVFSSFVGNISSLDQSDGHVLNRFPDRNEINFKNFLSRGGLERFFLSPERHDCGQLFVEEGDDCAKKLWKFFVHHLVFLRPLFAVNFIQPLSVIFEPAALAAKDESLVGGLRDKNGV